MKKALTFVMQFLLVASCNRPVEIVKYTDLVDKEGIIYKKSSGTPFSGFVKDFIEEGDSRPVSEGNYKDGRRDGHWTTVYENGQKAAEGNYKDGKYEGLWTKWWLNGEKLEEGNYKDGKKEGLWIQWLPSWKGKGNYKAAEGNYKNGKQVGLWISWFENGQKSFEQTYKDGKLDGFYSWTYENGQNAAEGNYKEGKLEGLWNEWYENGKKKAEINYKDGVVENRKDWDDNVSLTWKLLKKQNVSFKFDNDVENFRRALKDMREVTDLYYIMKENKLDVPESPEAFYTYLFPKN